MAITQCNQPHRCCLCIGAVCDTLSEQAENSWMGMQEEEALAQALARHNAGQEQEGMAEQEGMQDYPDDGARPDSLEQVPAELPVCAASLKPGICQSLTDGCANVYSSLLDFRVSGPTDHAA